MFTIRCMVSCSPWPCTQPPSCRILCDESDIDLPASSKSRPSETMCCNRRHAGTHDRSHKRIIRIRRLQQVVQRRNDCERGAHRQFHTAAVAKFEVSCASLADTLVAGFQFSVFNIPRQTLSGSRRFQSACLGDSSTLAGDLLAIGIDVRMVHFLLEQDL